MSTFASLVALLVLSVSAAPFPEASSTLAEASSSPAQASSLPAQPSSSPAQASSSPAQTSSSPAQTSSSPAQASSSPPPTTSSQVRASSAAPTTTSPSSNAATTTPTSDNTAVCTLSLNDPASFAASGAIQFLDAWFDANGTTDWLHQMDQAFSPAGPDFQSTLNCQNLDGSFCPPPSFACDKFEHPELRFIELAAANAHDFFSAAQDALVKKAIDNILDVGFIVSDFNPDEGSGDTDSTLAEIASLFTLGAEIAEIAGPEGAALSLIGAALAVGPTISDSSKPPDVSQLTSAVNQQLKKVFDGASDSIKSLDSQLFGGNTGNVSLDAALTTLSNAGLFKTDASAKNTITRIFSDGAFLLPQDQSPLLKSIEAGLDQIKIGLVGAVLKASNYSVFIDTTLTSDKCTAVGSRFINNECHILSKRVTPESSGETDTQPIDASIILKLDDPTFGYNIDPVAFYQNIDECAAAGGATDTSNLPVGQAFPQCFFSIPVIKVAGPHVCDLLPKDASVDTGPAPGTPANLGITFQGCSDSCAEAYAAFAYAV